VLPDMAAQAVIYTRISRDPGHDELGVRRQEKDCRALCERHGYDIAAVLSDDDRSAYSGKRRPAYEDLLQAVKAGEVNVVVAWHPDRLTRHPRELEDLIDALEAGGCTVSTVQAGDYDLATPTGRMVARVVGATARHESEHKSARLRRKHREIAEYGRVSGGGTRPFGFEDDRITHRPSEVAEIRALVRKTLDGTSLRRLAVDLNERGITTTTGGAWSPMVVRRLLMSARIAGIREHDGKVYPAVWKPIISTDDLRRVRAVFTAPARNSARPGAARYLLTGGLARCGLCGEKLVARPKHDGRRCYVCATGPGFTGCGKIRSLAEPVDDLVTDAVLARLDPEALASLSDTSADTEVIAELERLELRGGELAEMWAVGEMTRADLRRANEALEARRAALEAQLTRPKPTALLGAHGDLSKSWATLDVGTRRAVLESVLESVTIGPAVKGRNTFDPTRVSVAWRV
jgi:site-specific DNA recombinase